MKRTVTTVEQYSVWPVAAIKSSTPSKRTTLFRAVTYTRSPDSFSYVTVAPLVAGQPSPVLSIAGLSMMRRASEENVVFGCLLANRNESWRR